jgi:1-acyl-sn-glycerol-3-phosphate acyltransferase
MPVSPHPRYSLPKTFVLALGLALAGTAFGQPRRSFRQDAQMCIARLEPPLRIVGTENIPTRGPCLLTMNHYARPGFHAWWIALAVSAAVPVDIHWVMTAAWTYHDPLRSRVLTPISRILFRRLASIYDFTPMPPMPPNPRDTLARTVAVRKVLAYAKQAPNRVIALAPEGADAPGGALELPPSGVGRFLSLLVHMGFNLVPVGAYEERGEFCLRFGPAFQPSQPTGASNRERDLKVRWEVMQHIAHELPDHLCGAFARVKEDR